MRNVLLVLLPLWVGLTSGFIVPSVFQEVFFDDLNNIHFIRNSDIRTRDTQNEIATNTKDTDAKIFTPAKTLCNENNINKLEEDLYENIPKKDVNVNERSFIFIKQRTGKPLRKHFFVNAMSKRNNDDKTRAFYTLNRNNDFDEFRRRFSVGITNTDKGDTSLRLTKTDNEYNIKTMSDFNNNNARSNSKGQRKYLVSYVKPFLKPYIKISPKANKVTSKPEIKHFRDMFVQQRVIQRVSNKNPYKLVYPGGKTIDAIANPNEGIYLVNNNKKILNGNTKDGDDTLDVLIKNKSLDQAFGTENKSRLDHFGLRYCPDCSEKPMKQNLSNRVFFEKKCKCKIPK